jgi:hypothetical protein
MKMRLGRARGPSWIGEKRVGDMEGIKAEDRYTVRKRRDKRERRSLAELQMKTPLRPR